MSTHIYDPVYPSVIKSEKPAHHAITAGLVRAAVGCALGTLIIAAPAPALAQTQDESSVTQTRVTAVEEQAAPSPLEVAASAKNAAHENIDTSSQSQAATAPEMPGESAISEGRGFSASEAEEATKAAAIAGTDTTVSADSVEAASPAKAPSAPGVVPPSDPAPLAPSDPSLDDVTALVNDSGPESDEAIYRGVKHHMTITATDKDTGDRYSTKGSTYWDKNSPQSPRQGTHAILNSDKASQKLTGTVTLENTSDTTQHVLEIVTLPAFDPIKDDSKANSRMKLVLDGDRIPANGIIPNITNAEIVYCIVGGDYHPLSYFYSTVPNFSPSMLTAFTIRMDLAPGQKVSQDFPLIISNFDAIKHQVDHLDDGTYGQDISLDPSLRQVTLHETPYVWTNALGADMPWTAVHLHLAKPNTYSMKATDNVTCGDEHWLPSILVKDSEAGRRYELAPEAVMQALPPLSKSDITFSNYGMTGEQKTLFTDGVLRIHLENAFDAINDLGYSVNIQPNGKSIWPYYSYSTAGHPNWEIPSKPTTPGKEGDDEGKGATFYLEVQPIFRTRDLELDPGDTWCPEDSLISAMARFESMYNMHQTGEDHLFKNGTYGFELRNDDGELVAHGNGNKFHACNGDCELNKGQKEQSESLTLDPGKYSVTYSYTIDPEHVVTKTASITMGDPDAPDDPDTPDIPDDPIDPAPHTDDPGAVVDPVPEDTTVAEVVQVAETGPTAASDTSVQQAHTTPVANEHVIPATGDTNTAATTGILGALGTLVAAAVAFVTRKGQRE